jgi:hypothetical protein
VRAFWLSNAGDDAFVTYANVTCKRHLQIADAESCAEGTDLPGRVDRFGLPGVFLRNRYAAAAL